MLDKNIQKKILDFVYIKPRTIQEISQLIGKNWRTADTYVERISQETGLIAGRTFRGGTRGALKIVFWNNIEKISSNQFQERLMKQIESTRHKEDFSPLDIYQYVDRSKKRAFSEVVEDESVSTKQDLEEFFAKAEKQILYFSGNMSFLELKEKKKSTLNIIESAAKRGVSIKIVARIDIESLNNFRKLIEINNKIGKDMIEIRHSLQPLRGFILDDKEVRLKEEKEAGERKKGAPKTSTRIFYEIYDEEWVAWLQKVFWNLFSTSIDANIRVKDLEMVKKL